MKFDEACSVERVKLKEMAASVKALKKHPVFAPKLETDPSRDEPEMIANLMLAYRHLEDAAMRLGKAIQAFDGGKSVYDK